MSNTPSPEFSNDRPLSSKIEDKLNRAPFAERVACVLRGVPKGTGLVVGIHGPWGDGKTTVLNLLRLELQADSQVIVRDFNPWRLSDEDSMLRGFFTMLAEAIGKSLSTRMEQTRSAAAKWTKPFRWVTKPLGWFWKPAETADDLLARIGEIAATGDTVVLDELRSRIDKQLKQSENRIIVLVDDIDRLDKHETHTLFRLVKACADFPNVCYVLAFDDVAVAKSLGTQYGAGDEASGRAFLEKIIQVPLKLPIAMKEDLRSLCFQHVDQAISAAGIELSRKEVDAFVSGFDRGVSIRLDTPRAAKRYGNALMFALPLLVGEVNAVDLLLMEAVRAFYPAVYECVRIHHADFSGVESEYGPGEKKKPIGASLLEPTIESLPANEQAAIKYLLNSLFPRLGRAYGEGVYGSSSLEQWAKRKRICSPDYCPRYFAYAVAQNDVRDSQVDAICAKAAAGRRADVNEALALYFREGKARRVIERLRQREEDTPPEAVPTLCLALAANADRIPNVPSLFRSAEAASQAAILIAQLISRLPAGQSRVELAKEIIAIADPLWFGDECLGWLHVTDETDRSDQNALTGDELDEVRKVLVDRVKARALEGHPLFSTEVPQEQSLLFEWLLVDGRAPVQSHLSGVFTKDSSSIATFLQAMAPRMRSLGSGVWRVGDLDGDSLKHIKKIYDLDALAELIRKHLDGDFENPEWESDKDRPVERRLAEQFMFVYNMWKKEGEPEDGKELNASRRVRSRKKKPKDENDGE